MNVKIEKSWKKVLSEYFKKEEWKKLTDFIRNEYLSKTIYPKPKDIFKSFELTKFDDVKVIILGQDPYHNPNQAHGLSFSVLENITPPPSLKNIYKELESDLKIKKDFTNGNLTSWAEQGVLLLNAILTVVKKFPASHHKKGWEEFTDFVIKTISDQKENCVFILWGNYAKSKEGLIDPKKHLILKSPHPSPFSANSGFFGSGHFSQTNTYLKKHNKKEINW
ncbi:uracil-DNA glycosylase [Candidatus Campbellbacteria bacterium]|nr:MAG: uracil-DNA glycosylase [Candidatus Campbellbacteria bacterium]